MQENYADTPKRQRTLLERVAELEQWKVDVADVHEKIFARLKRVEDRVDSILGSGPKGAEEYPRPERVR